MTDKLILKFDEEQGWSQVDEQGNKLSQQKVDMTESWGLYDTKENVWLGDNEGPKLFNPMLAKVAARVTEKSLGYEPGRVAAKLFDEPNLRLRDKVKLQMSAEEALRRLEAGEL